MPQQSSLAAQLYIQLQKRQVSQTENTIGVSFFILAAASVLIITYLNYSPNVGTDLFRKMNMNFALAPTAATMIFCGTRYRGTALRMLTVRPVILLGEASYSIYLVHEVVLAGGAKVSGAAAHSLGYDLVKLLLLVVVVLAVSLALFAFFETSARRWLRQRSPFPAERLQIPR